jgi:ammonium transporter, Amt family
MDKRKLFYRLFSVLLGVIVLYSFGFGAIAQDETPAEEDTAAEVVVAEEAVEEVALTAETVQTNLNQIWLLLAGFLVFFMQAGFAMLEGGFIRHTGVVNSLAENFMDACVTGIVFFIVGYGVAYGAYDAEAGIGSPLLGQVEIALGGITGAGDGDGFKFIDFFFQFAFAGAAATIATGAMAERTNFVGKLIYSAILGAIIYPVVVFWTWGGGWIAELGFIDFAGSTIVHMTGGVVALIGAYMVGPRAGRVFGAPPRPSNMALAAIGTFILWFGWYGFNVGSTLEATDPNTLGLVAVNTTLAAAMGALAAMMFQYVRTQKWDLGFILNGSLAGLVGITAGCASVTPIGAIIIGGLSGVVVVLAVSFTEMIKVDDAVGAFAVHGVCGAFGTLMIGVVGSAALGAPSLLDGGVATTLITQATGVFAVIVWAGVTSFLMFGALKAAGLLRMHSEGDEVGIDAYEHGATLWPNVLPLGEPSLDGGD